MSGLLLHLLLQEPGVPSVARCSQTTCCYSNLWLIMVSVTLAICFKGLLVLSSGPKDYLSKSDLPNSINMLFFLKILPNCNKTRDNLQYLCSLMTQHQQTGISTPGLSSCKINISVSLRRFAWRKDRLRVPASLCLLAKWIQSLGLSNRGSRDSLN